MWAFKKLKSSKKIIIIDKTKVNSRQFVRFSIDKELKEGETSSWTEVVNYNKKATILCFSVNSIVVSNIPTRN